MSACSTFTEHVWKPGECKNCFKPKSLHKLPPASEKAPLTHSNLKTNANHSNNHRTRSTGNFRPPVAKKPTIAVKPTMMVVDGQGVCAETGISEHSENKQVGGWNRNKEIMNSKPLNNNNNDDEIEGYSHVHRPYETNGRGNKIPSNNNNGLSEVLKEIAGLGPTPQLPGKDMNSRECFLGRINHCYKQSLERKVPPSCMVGEMKESQGKHVILSGSEEVISNEGGRFCYPEFSSGDESEDDAFFGSIQGEHESWDESDEELLAMEIRMRGQPRFANFRANTLSPVRFCVDKKWNTVPLRNKSLQRICAVDYDDSYDEILNGYGEDGVILYGQESMRSMVSSDSTSPDSSLTESSRSGTTSNSFQKLCNGGLSPSTPKDIKSNDPGYENLRGDVHVKESGKLARSNSKVQETHKTVLALKLEEKDGRIAVQTDKQEGNTDHVEVTGQTLTVSIVPTEEQAKPYRVVNLEQPLCKPYTIVDVSAAMVSEQPEGKVDNPRQRKSTPTTPNTPTTPSTPSAPLSPTQLTSGQVNANLKKSSAIRYQEVWTSSTSPRQKIPRVELVTGCAGPVIPPRRNSHKSAPTSPTATNISSKTIPVKSPNLSEIKFNSYNNAGMPPFPIIIHDEPSYARSCKNAIKVPIVINPNAYDNLAIYKSFLGTNGEMSMKEKTTSIVSSTYEEIETGVKEPESVVSKPVEFTQVKRVPSTTERKMGSVAKKVKELNSSVNKDQTSPQKSMNTNRTSPSRSQKTTPEEISKTEGPLRPALCAGNSRENANTVLSQIVASIQPPQSPPGTPQAGPKGCSVEELYSLPPDANTTDNPVRPKSLFTQQNGVVTDVPRSIDGTCNRTHKEAVSSKPTSVHYANPVIAAQNTATTPKSDQGPPFPPPRSTSSPYHASNLLQRHFSNWSKPTSPTKATEAESVLHSETRRVVDAKPKRWISFKSFFRRKKTDDEEEREREREKGKLVGLDGTVIHMLPPPPVQRHHWFSEAKTEDNEKPSIVFMYRCESNTADSSLDPNLSKEEDNNSRVREAWGAAYNSSGDAKGQSADLPPPPPPPPSETISQQPDEARAEDAAPWAPRAGPFKQDSGGSSSSTSVTPASPPNGTRHHDERETGSDLSDISPSSATYSNLGHSRANMIPHKQPRQMKSGVSDDAIAFGEMTDHELPSESQPTPPPLPKKTITRANTEPAPKDPLKGSVENNLGVANPTYDIDPNWDTGSACSSLSSDVKVLDTESGDSLDRPVMKGRVSTSVGNSVSSLSALTVKERGSSSMDSLAAKHHTTGKHGRSIQKPQRQALYKGIENREEVVGKIRSLHTDSLKKLAIRCEDLFMAGQKDQLRFGVDSWSNFRLASNKPCCEAGDAIYYTASYAKDPLNNYAVKICKSKAKESQRQYYHSLAVRQSLSVNFNIQQDCGHFLADVPVRLLPWEDPNAPDEEEEEEEEGGKEKEQVKGTKMIKKDVNSRTAPSQNGNFNNLGTISKQRSRVVVITREVPFQTVAEFVDEARVRHTRNPDLYERQVCLLLLQLCSGLEHLKPYHVTHCDLRLENLLLVPFRPGGGLLNFEPVEVNPNATCPARLLVSNFSQAKQKSRIMDSEVLRDQSRLAPEIITGTQYKKCDEFQTGILIYEMLHLSNPFEENPELKEKEYTRADLPPIPHRSLYTRGLQQLATCLLNPNPSERILISDAKDMLRCLLWGPREDLLLALGSVSGTTQRDAVLQNWLDIKRTLLMIKFAEKSLDKDSGVGLEDWLCSQYLAFATSDSLRRIVRLMHQH